MNIRIALPFIAFALSAQIFAKDQPVTLEQCPAPVQAVIRHYSKQATLEQIGLDAKTKAGGPAVYEARFLMKDGKHVEVHITPDGKVSGFEEKKAKTPEESQPKK